MIRSMAIQTVTVGLHMHFSNAFALLMAGNNSLVMTDCCSLMVDA